RPGNMVLVVSGNIDPEEMSLIICDDAALRAKDDGGLNRRMLAETDTSLRNKSISQKMVVARPKVLIGFKDHDLTGDGRVLQKRDFVSQMVIEILFGKSSTNYDELYDGGVIDDTFTAYYSGYNDFGFSLIGGDTENPQQFQDRMMEILDKDVLKGVDPESFDRQKNKYLGKIIRTFNSVESVAYSMMNFFFKDLNPSDVIKIIESITIDDLNLRLKSHFITDQAASSLIEPEDGGVAS
ncbi:MAG: insulinase family protein, partial [Planctomycetota bacterium]